MKHNAAETKDLMTAESTLRNMKLHCTGAAEDHEESVKSGAEELKAIAAETKILKEMTSGAEGLTYVDTAASFLLLKQLRERPENFQVANRIRQVAHKEHSAALALLPGFKCHQGEQPCRRGPLCKSQGLDIGHDWEAGEGGCKGGGPQGVLR